MRVSSYANMGILSCYDFLPDHLIELSAVIEPHHEKTCIMLHANNNDADQPAHPSSLISAFIVRCLDSTIPTLAKYKISRLYLASVAEQTGLSLTWSPTPEDRFSRNVAQLIL